MPVLICGWDNGEGYDKYDKSGGNVELVQEERGFELSGGRRVRFQQRCGVDGGGTEARGNLSRMGPRYYMPWAHHVAWQSLATPSRERVSFLIVLLHRRACAMALCCPNLESFGFVGMTRAVLPVENSHFEHDVDISISHLWPLLDL